MKTSITTTVYEHRRRAFCIGIALLAAYYPVDVLKSAGTANLVARTVWILIIAGAAALQRSSRPRLSDHAARLVALTSGIASTVIVAGLGGSQGVYFGFLLGAPLAVLACVPDLASCAALTGLAATVGGAILLRLEHRPWLAVLEWIALSVVLNGLAAVATSLYARLTRDRADADRERAEALEARRAAEEKLRSAFERLATSEALFRDLAERALVGVYLIQDGVVKYANPRMAEMFGYAVDELIGLGELELVDPAERSAVQERVRSWASGELDAFHHQFRAVKKGGEAITVEAFGTRATRGSRAAVVGTLLDITERKRAEDDVLRIQKMESLAVLSGGIAHDFNNLLAAILGNLSLAREHASSDLLREVLAEASTATLRARDLTRQLLTFSRGGEPVRKRFELPAVVESSSSFAVRGSHSRFVLEVAPGLWPVEADEGQIGQVVQNLVLNAVQAMPTGGIVRVSAVNVTSPPTMASPSGPARSVRVSVSDDGPGIPAELAQKVFDPYFTTKSSGSGLGLASAHSIVVRHGGYIGIASSAGQGATVYFELPAAPEGPVVARLDASGAVVKGSGRVVVMDDDDLVRSSATRMLRRLGFEVLPARDGTELLSICEREHAAGRTIDAAIMDLTIPCGVGGKEAVGLLRERAPRVRAIASSGYCSDPVMAEHERHGFAGVVAKPYSLQDLSEVLHRVLGERAAPRASSTG